MADKISGAQYGAASPDDLKASGYRQPAWFHKKQEVDDKGFPVEKPSASQKADIPATENKATMPKIANKVAKAKRILPVKKKGKK